MFTQTRSLAVGLVISAAIIVGAASRVTAQAPAYTPPGFYNPVPVHQPYAGIPFNYGGYHPHYTPQLYQPMSSYGHYRGYQSSNGIYYPGWQNNGQPFVNGYPRMSYPSATGGFGYGPIPETTPR